MAVPFFTKEQLMIIMLLGVKINNDYNSTLAIT